MKLRSTLTSPFGLKILVAASHLGLRNQLEVIPADTLDPNDPLRSDNPLGKMPVLILDNGRRIYDSTVIMEYINHLGGGDRLIPSDWEARLDCLTLQALCDGMLDAALLVLYEGRRPQGIQYQPWIENQKAKIARSLGMLAKDPPSPQRADAGTITLACLLSYLDRRKQLDWRPAYPELVVWFDSFRAFVPAFDHATA